MTIPKLIIIPLIVVILSQLLKVLLNGYKEKKINWRFIIEYGGMPSSHAAFLTSLTTAVALTKGINSTAFAVCVIISTILIRDAFGLRMYIEKHGKILLRLIKKQPQEERIKISDEVLDHRVGHTYFEIIMGIILGIILTLIIYPLF